MPASPTAPTPDELLEDIFQPGVTLEEEWQQWLAMIRRINEDQPDEPAPEEGPEEDS
jgi:hypothetical protein